MSPRAPSAETLVRTARRRARDYLFVRPRTFGAVREDIARLYLRGHGIEVGALNNPLRVPPAVKVTYVDYLPIEVLRSHHGHLLADGQALTPPEIVDDGERLTSLPSESVDFVVANHFLEHCEDPIGTVQAHLRVLRPGGVLLYSVPDKRSSFDVDRAITTREHMIRDHEEGPEWSRDDHYRDWALLVDKVSEDEVEAHAQDLMARRFSIHFHVWTPDAYLDLLVYCQSHGEGFELAHFQSNSDIELISVLRKR